MKFLHTPLKDVYLIELEIFRDDRGQFLRQFCAKEFEKIGFIRPVVQINHSATTQKGSIRGLHYQAPPACEAKIIRCMKGTVFDVMVDLRPDSTSFLQWYGVELTDELPAMVFIPEGFAHGFQTLSDNVEMLYLHSDFYTPEHERGIRFDDPVLSINWPLDVTSISSRDLNFSMLNNDFKGILP